MKNKKAIIILSSIVVICAVGFIVSPLVNWPVDRESASGDIGKSSRFSRKTATESISNIEELIQNDAEYKDGIVASFVVMHTRVQQFGVLVNMSNEVAGNIPEFSSVLEDMNQLAPLVNNVNDLLLHAGDDLGSTLGGEQRPNLTQNIINAAVAYNTLQKQNELADLFIETTDNYLKEDEGDDVLKFVRDQWLDYQKMTAALNNDKKGAKRLDNKGYLLSSNESLSASLSFGGACQLALISSAGLSNSLSLPTNYAKNGEILSDVANAILSGRPPIIVPNSEILSGRPPIIDPNSEILSGRFIFPMIIPLNAEVLSGRPPIIDSNSEVIGNLPIISLGNIASAFNEVAIKLQDASVLNQNFLLIGQLGEVINSTALGAKSTLTI